MLKDLSPDQREVIKTFQTLAEQFARGGIDEGELSAFVSQLPTLTHEHLDTLAALAEAQAHINPRLGWAIATVADAATERQKDTPFLQAKAAWYLGRAANRYFRPRRAGAALKRANAGFKELKDEAWLAACKWQRHVLAWAQPDLHKCEAEVQEALEFFLTTDSPLSDFQDDCRLTLAYIQALIGRFADSLNNLAACEKSFVARQDQLNQLRCHLVKGNVLRRQAKMDDAVSELNACIKNGEKISAPVEVALSQLQLGSALSKRHDRPGAYKKAEKVFQEAAARFRTLDLPFWEALCRDGLAVVFISTGRLSLATEELAYCRQVFREYEVDSPLAQALINSGWLETYKANYERGLGFLVQSDNLCRQVGNSYLVGGSTMHLGEIYLEMGRYQQALRYLEESSECFQKLKSYDRVAEVGLRLARCWVYLGRPDQALKALSQVEVNAKKSKQGNIFPYLYLRRAEAYSVDGKKQKAVKALRTAVLMAGRLNDDTGAALARRLLGEALCDLGQLGEAAENIESAEKTFNEIGLLIEQAACQIAWGQYYRKTDDLEAAKKSFLMALTTGEELAPDIVWEAQAGLAALTENAGNELAALSHYRQMVQALVRLRQDLWQPALAGNFLKRPMRALEQAIRLAVNAGSARDVLDFIEASKGQVMANLFQRPISIDSTKKPPKLANLVAEIRWRQERIRVMSGDVGWLQTADLRKMRVEIISLVRQYDLLRGQLERKNRKTDHALLPAGNEFNLVQFREAANKSFGEDWLALDYFLTEDNLSCVCLTGENCELIETSYPSFIRMMFDGSGHARTTGQWQEKELKMLGEWLLPDTVLNKLGPDTVLIIVPHKQLHSLPWPALSAGGKRLVETADSVIVPSLQSLSVLMRRPDKRIPADRGLFLAVSEFGKRHGPLPQTIDEVKSLERLYPESETLLDEASTWPAILELAEEKGLADFSFLHIASHGFADNVSGRLSGLAFYDRDVWLDELWDCAPLPPMVTLSACSGSQSKLYEGDEQVGLATTCLAAGTQHVIASLWPIHDKEAAALMVNFYSYLMLGDGVAHALGKAQRKAAQAGKDVAHWAGFRCTGLPN